MHKRIAFLVILSLLFTAECAFAQTSIKAEVDRATLTTDDELIYKIVIASSEKKLPAPQVPKFEGFSVISQADSSTASFVKGEIKTILVYAFILVPAGTGKFTISPSTIKVKDKTYTSDSFEIEVTQGKDLPNSPAQEEPSLPSQPQSGEPQTTL